MRGGEGPCAPGRLQVVVVRCDPRNPATPIWRAAPAHQVAFARRASWAQPLTISNSQFPTPDTSRRCLTLAVSFRAWRSEVRMSRKQDHVRFQQTDLPLGPGRSSGVVDKFNLTSMLSTANYGPLGFDRRSPPSRGLDRGVPPFNLERSGMAPPRPSSMLSDGDSATSLESSPRFLLPSPSLVSSLLSSGAEDPAVPRIEWQLWRRRSTKRASMRF